MTKRKARPEVLNSKTTRYKTNCGNMYLRMGYDDNGELFEVFASMGKSGNCVYSHLEAVSRLLCDIFKYEDIALEDKLHAIEHLQSINCGNSWVSKGEKYLSCLDLISREVAKELKKSEKKEITQQTQEKA